MPTPLDPALLAAIVAEPDDDALRLVAADWFEEHGEGVRAEFVRKSIAYPHASFVRLTEKDPFPLLGLQPASPKPVHVGWDHEKSEPLHELRTWMWGETDEIGCAIQDMGRNLDYREDRGFISAVRCRLDDWLSHGSWLCKLHPVLKVAIIDRRPWSGRYSVADTAPNLWGWWAESPQVYATGADCVPYAIVEELKEDPRRDVRVSAVESLYGNGMGRVLFRSEEVARDALSQAALRWARKLAAQPV